MITCSAGLGFWFQDSITSNFISCPNVCNPEIKIRNIKDIKEIKIISLKTVTEGNNCLFERNVVIKRMKSNYGMTVNGNETRAQRRRPVREETLS